MARLLEHDAELGHFSSFHFDGHWDSNGTSMIAAICRVLGKPAMRVRRFPWALVGLARPAVPLFRELWELRDLWRQPVRLDNARLRAMLGEEPHTPWDDAVRATLIGLGCLAASQSAVG